jgi:hypothetical protein
MPLRGTRLHKDYWAYLLLFLFVATDMTYQLRNAVDRLDELLHATTKARVPFGVSVYPLQVNRVNPEAASAGLHVGG